MTQRSYNLHDGKRGAALAIRVTTRATKNKIMGALSDGTVKIHIAAEATGGQANDELIDFLSDILQVDKKQIELVAGDTGRDKLVSVLDMDSETLHNKIVKNIE